MSCMNPHQLQKKALNNLAQEDYCSTPALLESGDTKITVGFTRVSTSEQISFEGLPKANYASGQQHTPRLAPE